VERHKISSASRKTGDEHRHSFGARWFGGRNQWDWNSEAVVQAGDFGNHSIFAWTVSFDSGYTWDTTWQPRLGLKVDVASGSHSLTNGTQGTFDALYFKSGYFNDASLIRPANIKSATRASVGRTGASLDWFMIPSPYSGEAR